MSEEACFMGDFAGAVFRRWRFRQYKRAGMGLKKFQAACSANQVVEPEAGRTVNRK
jgi:hypothetical protein